MEEQLGPKDRELGSFSEVNVAPAQPHDQAHTPPKDKFCFR